ncbi:MAG: PLP-dependent aminotransferase family protein [Eubacteriales bacterium]
MYSFAKRLDNVSGSAIRQIFSLLADPDIISFAGGNPAPESFPKEEIAKISQKSLLEKGDTILQYGGTLGMPAFIDVVVDMYKKYGVNASNNEIIITTGSSQGIELMSKAFLNPGDSVLVESPTFLGALQTFLTYEANVVEVAMDDEGIILKELEDAIVKNKPKFLYTIPTFQNPTGKTMGKKRRQEVYDVCKKYNVLILEDDPYRELRYSGEKLPLIKSMDTQGIVVNLLSFSKIISPGLRVGAVNASSDIIAKFNILKQGIDVHTPNLTQEIALEYVKEGMLDGHIKKICKMYTKKINAMQSAIKKYFPEEIKVTHPDGGLFIWATLPDYVDAVEVFKAAVKAKVAFVPGTYFFAAGGHKNTLRLNFSMASEEKINIGIEKLSEVIKTFI